MARSRGVRIPIAGDPADLQKATGDAARSLEKLQKDGARALDELAKKSEGASLAQRRALLQVETAQDRAAAAVKRYGEDSIQARRAVLKYDEALDQVRRSSSEVESATDKAGSAADALGGKMGKGGKLAAGLLGTIGVAETLRTTLENALTVDRGQRDLGARLGLTPAQAKTAGKTAGRLYAKAYGENLGDVTRAVDAVVSSIRGMREATQADVERAAGQALNFARVFEVDVAEAVTSVSTLLNSGLAENSTQAFDLLTTAAQRVPAGIRDELLAATAEYSQFFAQVGMDGEEAFGVLLAGSTKGRIGIDKAADAVKEFTIRGTDLSTTSREAYKAIGLDAEDMSRKLLKGGREGQDATRKIADGLLGIKDPAKRSNEAIKLFGTPLEDLGTKNVPAFLRAISGAKTGMEGFAGASERIGTNLNGGPAAAIERFKRRVTKAFTDGFGSAIIAGEDAVSWVKDNWKTAIFIPGGLAGAMLLAFKTAFNAVRKPVADTTAFILRRFDNMLGGLTTFLSAAGRIPGIGGKFRAAARGIDEAREKLRATADAIQGVNDKKIKLRVDDKELLAALTSARSLRELATDSRFALSQRPRSGGRRGGRVGSLGFRAGGMVPVAVSSGERLRFPDGSWSTVPGARVAADNVDTAVPAGTEVYTDHGQQLLAMGASRSFALRMQRPHFARGGKVRLGQGYQGNATTAGFEAGLGGATGVGGSFLNELIAGTTGNRDVAPRAQVRATGPSTERGDGSGAGGFAKYGLTAGQATRARRMLGTATAIARKGMPYQYGGFGNPSYDCSGYVSKILAAGGIGNGRMVVAQGTGLYVHGRPGPGKYVTWGVRGSSGRNAHTMIKLGNRYFESGGGAGPGERRGWNGAFQMRHFPGFRKGGKVRSLNTLVDATARPSATDEGGTRAAFAALAKRLADSTRVSYDALARLVARVTTMAAKERRDGDKVDARRFDAVRNLARAEQGRRLAQPIVRLQATQDRLSRADTRLGLQQRISGVTGEAAIRQQLDRAGSALGSLSARRTELVRALDRAKALGNTKAVSELTTALRGLDDQTLEVQASMADLNRELKDTQRQQVEQALEARTANASARLQLAQTTQGMSDDVEALRGNADAAYAVYADAVATFGAESTQAITALTALRGTWTDLAQGMRDQQLEGTRGALTALDRELLLAQIDTPGDTTDDQRIVRERLRIAEEALAAARAGGDTAAIDEFGPLVLQLREAIEAFAQQAAQSQTAMEDLLREMLAQRDQALRVAATEGGVLKQAIADAVSGQIGGLFGLGQQTPSFGGGGVRL
ncbi:phage tail tape measure protein [Paraconexibacter algicola]|uniref:NlpC/P60 domain-containing protein n=1 Tax=Paraconexibacter algicola TaxID=2133960 RepID=A0A2T4UE22_9ACTN|nr:phage tail tape measure protein [Paraconexibacter algicola]PTL55756.1 hypothetical protein C7Y72_19195 [Paraconexibacter algicola]